MLSGGVSVSRAQQEPGRVGQHRLQFNVGEVRQVGVPDERVPAAVQTHLAVDLHQPHHSAQHLRCTTSSLTEIRLSVCPLSLIHI